MPIWIWLTTLLKGFLPFDGKRIGKIIWVLVLSAVAIGIYHKTFIAKTQHNEIATQIINQCSSDGGVFGVRINLWKFFIKLGL